MENKAQSQKLHQIVIILIFLMGGAFAGLAGAKEGVAHARVAIGAHPFQVEVASTPAEQALGLMFRQELAKDGGMLFVFATEQPVAMWMKNTLISLDILFIREDKTVAQIARKAVPHSLALIESGEPVKYVLELRGGTAEALGLAVGDRMEYAPGP